MLKISSSPTISIQSDEKPVIETEESDLLSDEEVEQQLKSSPPPKTLPSKIIKEEEIISDEKPSIPTSLREIEKDEEFFEDILQYRKDRFEIDEGDFCINCGNELKEDEGFTNTRLGRKYDDICDACKRLSPHDPNSPYHGS